VAFEFHFYTLLGARVSRPSTDKILGPLDFARSSASFDPLFSPKNVDIEVG
jgi:hypothetical protein